MKRISHTTNLPFDSHSPLPVRFTSCHTSTTYQQVIINAASLFILYVTLPGEQRCCKSFNLLHVFLPLQHQLASMMLKGLTDHAPMLKGFTDYAPMLKGLTNYAPMLKGLTDHAPMLKGPDQSCLNAVWVRRELWPLQTL